MTNWTQTDLDRIAANRRSVHQGPALKPRPTRPQCRIGIDPAFRKGGFCVCVIDEDREVKFTTFTSFLDFVDWLPDAPDNALVVIENSNLQKVTFDMSGTKATVAKKSRNVGANQAASQYTVDVCVKRWGAERVRGVSPRQKGKKWTKSLFRARVQTERVQLFGYTGSQDQRDAFQLAVMW